MKIAIFSPYATVAPHFETELELAQRHLDNGDQVEIVNCYGDLANCDFNPQKEAIRCQECRGRREAGLFMLEPQTSCRSLTAGTWKPESDLKLRFDSVAELAAYRIDNFDIGYAALSSLVSMIRDPDPDLAATCDDSCKFYSLGGRSVWVYHGVFASRIAGPCLYLQWPLRIHAGYLACLSKIGDAVLVA